MFIVCVSLVFCSKNVNFISFTYFSTAKTLINTDEVDPRPDALRNGIVKPKNCINNLSGLEQSRNFKSLFLRRS